MPSFREGPVVGRPRPSHVRSQERGRWAGAGAPSPPVCLERTGPHGTHRDSPPTTGAGSRQPLSDEEEAEAMVSSRWGQQHVGSAAGAMWGADPEGPATQAPGAVTSALHPTQAPWGPAGPPTHRHSRGSGALSQEPRSKGGGEGPLACTQGSVAADAGRCPQVGTMPAPRWARGSETRSPWGSRCCSQRTGRRPHSLGTSGPCEGRVQPGGSQAEFPVLHPLEPPPPAQSPAVEGAPHPQQMDQTESGISGLPETASRSLGRARRELANSAPWWLLPPLLLRTASLQALGSERPPATSELHDRWG